jgi:hypothetical protein
MPTIGLTYDDEGGVKADVYAKPDDTLRLREVQATGGRDDFWCLNVENGGNRAYIYLSVEHAREMHAELDRAFGAGKLEEVGHV